MELVKNESGTAKNPMARNKGGYVKYNISTPENIGKTIQRLVNDVANNRMDPERVRLIDKLINTKMALMKNVELEQRITELEDMLEMNEGDQ